MGGALPGLELRVRCASRGALRGSEKDRNKAKMEILKEDLKGKATVPVSKFCKDLRTEGMKANIKKFRDENDQKISAHIKYFRNEVNSELSEDVIVAELILLLVMEKLVKDTEKGKMRTIELMLRDIRDLKSLERIRKRVRDHVRDVVDKERELDYDGGGKSTVTLTQMHTSAESLVEFWLMFMNLDSRLPFISGVHSRAAATSREGVSIPWNVRGEWNRERKVTCEPFDHEMDDIRGSVYLGFLSKVSYTGSESCNPRVELTIPSITFSIKTTCNKCSHRKKQSCEKKCGPCFIYRVAIEVCPTQWARDIHDLKPCRLEETYTIQSSTNVGSQVGAVVGTQPTLQVSASRQVGTVLSKQVRSYKWCPASRDPIGENPLSVKWPWEFSTFSNGTEMQFNKNWKVPSSKTLLADDPAHTHMPTPVSASWDVHPKSQPQQLPLAWDMTVTVQTAVLKEAIRTWYSAHEVSTITYAGQLTF